MVWGESLSKPSNSSPKPLERISADNLAISVSNFLERRTTASIESMEEALYQYRLQDK